MQYSDETEGELAIFRTARAPTCATARPRCRTASSPRPTTSPTCSKWRCSLKEAGLLRPLERQCGDVNIIPLFETIGDLRNAAGVMDRLFTCPPTGAAARRATSRK
jgi:phosphoenolpyruvate carboxylase